MTLRKTPLLACLNDAALSALLRAGRVWHYPRYSSLGREGTRSAVLAVVLGRRGKKERTRLRQAGVIGPDEW